MAGYIGSKAAVVQADGYTKTEADDRYVEGDDTLYVDQTNNRVGIGTSSPDTPLEVQLGSSGNAVKLSSSADGASVYLAFEQQESGTKYVRGRIRAASNGADGGLIFETGSSGSMSQRLRIDASGGISKNGSFSYSGTSDDFYWNTGSGDRFRFHSGTTSSRDLVGFSNPNGVVGAIETNGSSTSYNTSSDYRLKENVVDLTSATTRLKQLEPKRFNFIADADTTVDGFIAHEVQTVVPEATTGTHNEVDDDGNPVMQGIDQSKLVPLLTAALQEAITEIETLKTKVAALEAEE